MNTVIIIIITVMSGMTVDRDQAELVDQLLLLLGSNPGMTIDSVMIKTSPK